MLVQQRFYIRMHGPVSRVNWKELLNLRCLICCVHVGEDRREFTFVSEYEGRRTEKKEKKRIKRLKGKCMNYNMH